MRLTVAQALCGVAVYLVVITATFSHAQQGRATQNQRRPTIGNPAVLKRSGSKSLNELSDKSSLEPMRLQQKMEMRAKAFETLSNIQKKSSDTSSKINRNIK